MASNSTDSLKPYRHIQIKTILKKKNKNHKRDFKAKDLCREDDTNEYLHESKQETAESVTCTRNAKQISEFPHA